MDKSVCDGGGGGGVMEEAAPVFEGEVCGYDGGGSKVTTVEDLVEEIRASGVEAEVAEFVDDEEVWGGPGGQSSMQSVSGLSGDEVVDQVGGGYEADAIASQTRELPD